MTGLFEMHVRVGNDPRGFAEFLVLRDELAKLSHPARPDVDLALVEQLCLTLFQKNGAELQTVAAFALARSHRHGLEGMGQGLELVATLSEQWLNLWPPMAAARLDILAWLFSQLPPLLRSLVLDTRDLPALVDLDGQLARLVQRLEHQVSAPLVTLQTLRQQVHNLMQRLQRNVLPDPTPYGIWMPQAEPERRLPVVILSQPPALPSREPRRTRRTPWLLALVATLLLACGLAWNSGWRLAADSEGRYYWVNNSHQAQPRLEPLRLQGLFDAGSAELKPEASNSLLKALEVFKPRPDWLIVIIGHSDATGSAEHNLQLSQARASAVRSWMQRLGDIPDSCLAVQGYGANHPLASDRTEAGRAANRRVEIRLLPASGACAAASVETGDSHTS